MEQVPFRPPLMDGLPGPGPAATGYILRLYVSGTTVRSERAIASMRRLCETHLKGDYVLEVFDVYQNPGATKEDQIVAVPTLVKLLPVPLRRLIGDLSDRERVLAALDIVPKTGPVG
jgi:circadian clock protein KaiB